MLLAATRGGSQGHRFALLRRAQCLCQVAGRVDEKRETAHDSLGAVRSPFTSICTRPLLKDARFAEVSILLATFEMRCCSGSIRSDVQV